MADATTRLRAEKQDYDSNDDAWGTHLNAGVFDVFDQAIAGVIAVPVAGNVVLDVQNYISDQARNAGLLLTGAGGFTITVPAVQKLYAVANLCAADVTITPLGGVGSVIRAGTGATWLTDGATGRTIDNTLDKVKAPVAPVSMANQRVTNVGTPTAAADAVPKAYADAIVESVGDLASSAQDSAQAAAESEGIVSGLYNNFQRRYLGPKTADPTLDNFGAPLQAGALYFNTSANQMRVYTGANWIVLAVMTVASQAQAVAGVDNTTVMTPLRVAQHVDPRFAALIGAGPDLIIQDRKASGTGGGATIAGTQQRALNTVAFTSGEVAYSLSSDTLTISATGKYRFEVAAPASQAGPHKAFLVRGASTIVGYGTNSSSSSSPNIMTFSMIDEVVDAVAGDAFRVDHFTTSATAVGFGLPISQGPEIYTTLKVKRIG